MLLSVGIMESPSHAVLHTSPRFQREPGEPRDAALLRARAHFQTFLTQTEHLLRRHPYQWFNFTPLNPVADDARPVA